jgi:hypothetical protein
MIAASIARKAPQGQTGTAEVPPKTMDVPTAGRVYFDLSRNGSYEAAKRGDLPTIRIGRLLRVPIAALERKLEQAGSDQGA